MTGGAPPGGGAQGPKSPDPGTGGTPAETAAPPQPETQDIMTAEQAIALAAQNLRTIILTYVDEDSVETTREVEPYSYRPGKQGAIRLFAFDVNKNQIRGFRGDRIVAATVTENSYIPRWVVEI